MILQFSPSGMAQLAGCSGLDPSGVCCQLRVEETTLLIIDGLSPVFSDVLVGCCGIALIGTTGHLPHRLSYSEGVASVHQAVAGF